LGTLACSVIEHQFVDSRTTLAAEQALVGASNLFNLFGSRKYFYVQRVILTHFRWCAGSAHPAMMVFMKQDRVSTRKKQQTLSLYKSIHMLMQIFYSEKIINSSDMMTEWSHHVFDTSLSSSLSAVTFSCEMRMERLRFFMRENNNNGYLILCNIGYYE
jgi:hypothetical protein